MGDKKRKLVENATEETIAPEGKKVKKDRKEKERIENDVEPTPSREEAKEKKEKKEMKQRWKIERDEKKARKKEEKQRRKEQSASASAGNLDPEARKEKKERKDKKYNNNKKKKASSQSDNKSEPTQEEPVNEDAEASNEQDEETAQKNSRFICFVGNLPYSANTESLTKHFEKNPPAEVRVATKKDDPKNRCRGFAFIEFENYDRMKTCLKLYHHSTFDDGKYPPRRINVELTAGGGGNKSEHRKAKIQAKNEKLLDERQRNAKEINKDKKKHDKKAKPVGAEASGANAVGVDGGNEEDDKYAGVHPSRRPRMW